MWPPTHHTCVVGSGGAVSEAPLLDLVGSVAIRGCTCRRRLMTWMSMQWPVSWSVSVPVLVEYGTLVCHWPNFLERKVFSGVATQRRCAPHRCCHRQGGVYACLTSSFV